MMKSKEFDRPTGLERGAPNSAEFCAPVVMEDVPHDCWPLLVSAIEAAATLEANGALLANPRMLLRPLHVAEALASVRLDGGEASPEDLLRLEASPLNAEVEKESSPAVHAAANCLSAMRYGEERLDDLGFKCGLLQGLHRILTFRLGDDLRPGEFRQDDDVRRELPSLEAAMNADPPTHLRLVHALQVHRRLMTLAPFHSANGRLARIVLALMLQQLNRHSAPWLCLSAAFAAKPWQYLEAINGDSQAWIKFGLERIADAAWNGVTLSHRLIETHRELEATVHENGGSERDSRLLELLFESPIVTVPFLERRLALPYTTAKRDVRRFVELGMLRKLKGDSPNAFVCDSVLTTWRNDHSSRPADVVRRNAHDDLPGPARLAGPTPNSPLTSDTHAAKTGSYCRR